MCYIFYTCTGFKLSVKKKLLCKEIPMHFLLNFIMSVSLIHFHFLVHFLHNISYCNIFHNLHLFLKKLSFIVFSWRLIWENFTRLPQLYYLEYLLSVHNSSTLFSITVNMISKSEAKMSEHNTFTWSMSHEAIIKYICQESIKSYK